MSYQHMYLIDLRRAKNTFKYLLPCCVMLFICLVLWSSQASALSVQEEVAIDRQAGLLDRPWKINLIRVSTREYLKRRAVVRTGFRVHDRNAHKAEQTPDAAYASITKTPTSGSTVPGQSNIDSVQNPTGVSASAPSSGSAPTPSNSPAPTPTPSKTVPTPEEKFDGWSHVSDPPPPPTFNPSPYPSISK